MTPKPWENAEGYPDPTAYNALRPIMQEDAALEGKVNFLIKVLKFIIAESGFELLARIELKDKKTGGPLLQEAVAACESWGLHFDAINESLPSWIAAFKNAPRKVGASEYWDDRAVPVGIQPEMYQVIGAIGLPAVLEQCAEELAELTQATLKMARALRGENPTPVTHSQAAEHLHEELGDVRLCLKVLDAAMGGDNTAAVEAEKLRRWLDRITQEQKNPE